MKESPASISIPDSMPKDGLVAYWDFQEETDGGFLSKGNQRYRLDVVGGNIPRVDNGVFGSALRFGEGPWLRGMRAGCPGLDIHGRDASFSVVAWVKRTNPGATGCQAVAGMWNEHGLRQYCLFLNLHIHDSAEQVGAHVSAHGGATSGEKYCMEAAIGATPVPYDKWQCVAISYDGCEAGAWLNGRLDHRGARNPLAHPEGIFNGGPDGADFTVGAVQRPEWVDEERKPHGAVTANLFHGLLGGLAVFDRALSEKEMQALAALIPPPGTN